MEPMGRGELGPHRIFSEVQILLYFGPHQSIYFSENNTVRGPRCTLVELSRCRSRNYTFIALISKRAVKEN